MQNKNAEQKHEDAAGCPNGEFAHDRAALRDMGNTVERLEETSWKTAEDDPKRVDAKKMGHGVEGAEELW